MRIFGYIALVTLLAGCNPDGIGCFKSTGQIETVSVDVADFSTIDVSSNIEVHLVSGTTRYVELTAGSNIIPGIRMEVVDGVLYLENLNTCNWTRKYINPVVEISNPALTKIVQHGFGKIISNGILTYDELVLENDGGSGDFILELDINSLRISSNEVANFYLTGTAQQLFIGFYYADEIFFAEDLQVNNCVITHYGSNSIHLNVLESLKGEIYGFGDVILHQQMPQTVDVIESGSGKLIFDL